MSVDTSVDTGYSVAGVPITEIQQRVFEVLCALVAFCDAHKICYYLVGGTLLGGLRHRGFIPWDDDIDIVVPRPDYHRLLALLDQFPPPLQGIHPSCDPATPYPFLIVRDANSNMVIDYARPFDRGIGVDVFPLDAVPLAHWRRHILFGAIRLMRALSMNKQRGFYQRPVSVANRLKFTMLSATCRLMPARLIYRIYDWIVARGDVHGSALVANLYGLYGTREVVGKQVFGDGCLIEFEGRVFQAPAQPESYLGAVYGDFWRFPPLHQRHSGHRISTVSLC